MITTENNQVKQEDKNRIVITHCPLQTDAEKVWKMAKEDKILIDIIKKQSELKKNKGIETFEQRHNIIATEEGYYLAFYEKDLQHA